MNSNGNALNLSRPVVVAVLAAFSLLGIGLRLFDLGNGLWYDEIVTLLNSVRQPFADIVTHFPGNNDHLLYSVLGNLSVSWFGDTAWSLRLPAALFGAATIPLLYAFGTRVTSRFEALAAAALLAVSYHHIWFSQNARGYSMLLFWTLLASHLLLKGLKDDKRAAFVGYAVVAALGVYTHLTMVFVVVCHAAVAAWQLLITERDEFEPRILINPLIGFVLAGLFSLLLYAPILIDVKTVFEEQDVTLTRQIATTGWAILETLKGLSIGFGMAGGMIFAAVLCFVGLWSYLRQSLAISALFVLPAPVILSVAVVLQHPIRPRFFFLLAGFGLLIAVRGAVVIGEWIAARLPTALRPGKRARSLPAIFVAALIVFSAFALPTLYRFPKQDYEQALRLIEKSKQADEAVVVFGPGAVIPFRGYYGKPWPEILDADDLRRVRENHSAVWLAYTFRRYIELGQPELMNMILTECAVAGVFPGTLAGGTIEVYKCPRG